MLPARRPTASRSRRSAPLVAALAAAALLLTACAGTDAVDTDAAGGPQLEALESASTGLLPPAERGPAPDLRGDTVTGGTADLSSLRGQVVVVNFWASWCAPCLAEADDLKKVSEATAGQGVSFLGVNIKDNRSAAARFEKTREIPYPSLYDQPGVSLLRFRSLVPQTPPSTVLVDRQGRLAGIFRGAVLASELQPVVERLAAEKS